LKGVLLTDGQECVGRVLISSTTPKSIAVMLRRRKFSDPEVLQHNEVEVLFTKILQKLLCDDKSPEV